MFWVIESASYPYMDINELNGVFNWTMTFRKDSDIFLPYGRIVQIKDHPPPGPDLDALIQDFGMKNQHLAHDRTNDSKAAWFVSKCNTKSNRESLVEEIMGSIPVDAYGKCSELFNTNFEEKICNRGCKENQYDCSNEHCYKMLETNYRYYLSFENSICQDYVTEKFFRPFKYDVIPITLNGADMNNLAPTHSFINALDYNTIEDLIQYLEKLSNNNALYASYFWWKDYYEVRNDPSKDRAQSYCDLCAKLNSPDEPRKMYKNMYKWWVRDSRCHHYKENFALNCLLPN